MSKKGRERRCEYLYSDGTRCNRIITRNYLERDRKHYCIFHTHASDKLEQFTKEMKGEIEAANLRFSEEINLQNLSEDKPSNMSKIDKIRSKFILNFEGIHIPPHCDLFRRCIFETDINFTNSVFSDTVDFSFSSFKGKVWFDYVFFLGATDFSSVKFYNVTSFSESKFEKNVSFNQANFHKKVTYYDAVFKILSSFVETVFEDEAQFLNVVFDGELHFIETFFHSNSFFREAIFNGDFIFEDVICHKKILFDNAVINRKIKIKKSIFNGISSYKDVFFKGEVEIIEVVFNSFASFERCKTIKGKIKFINTVFFASSSFNDIIYGENITFINCHFFNVSFIRSRLTDIVFSNCHFYLAKSWIIRRSNEIRYYLKEENTFYMSLLLQLYENEKEMIEILKRKKIYKKNYLAEHRQYLEKSRFKIFFKLVLKNSLKTITYPFLKLFPNSSYSLKEKIFTPEPNFFLIDFGEVRDNYMQLKVNMDRMKDYDLANDFYYGEMEMKRLGEKWYKPKRWFLSLYKTLSGYGNSPLRAVIMFFALIWIFSFPLLFMNLGARDLSAQINNKTVREQVVFKTSFIENLCEMASLSFYSITALSNLTRAPYEPLNRFTFYYVSTVQYIFRPVQIALIILAIRRKVKRGEE